MNRSPRVRVLALLLPTLLLPLGAGATSYTIDPVHSSVVFKVRHLGTSNFYGIFQEISGALEYDPASPDASSIRFEIPAESVYTRSEGRDRHLRSPDFLNAQQFPVIRFTSSKVEAIADGRLRVTGELELHGVKKTVVGEVEHTGTGKHPRSGKEIVGFETRLTIDRTDFGMDYMATPEGLGSEIEIVVAIEAGAE